MENDKQLPVRAILKQPGKTPRHFMVGVGLEDMQRVVGGYIRPINGGRIGLPDSLEMVMKDGPVELGFDNLVFPEGSATLPGDKVSGTVFFIACPDGSDYGRSLNNDEQRAVFDYCEANDIGGTQYGD